MSRRPAAAEAGVDVAVSLWLRLLKTHGLVLARVRRGLAGRLTLPQLDVLAQLSREPGGLNFRDLSRRLLVTAGNLTGIVDRLESEGLVRRVVAAADRRSFRILLTAAGRRRVAALVPRHRRDLAEAWSPVPASIQRSLRRLLGRAAAHLETVENGGAPRTPRRRRP